MTKAKHTRAGLGSTTRSISTSSPPLRHPRLSRLRRLAARRPRQQLNQLAVAASRLRKKLSRTASKLKSFNEQLRRLRSRLKLRLRQLHLGKTRDLSVARSGRPCFSQGIRLTSNPKKVGSTERLSSAPPSEAMQTNCRSVSQMAT